MEPVILHADKPRMIGIFDRLGQKSIWRHTGKQQALVFKLFAGVSPDGLLPETVEYPDHPWFIGVQYHPELKSRPFEPHPLFASFIAAAVEQARMV